MLRQEDAESEVSEVSEALHNCNRLPDCNCKPPIISWFLNPEARKAVYTEENSPDYGKGMTEEQL